MEKIQNYYNTDDPANNYTEILYRAGYGSQSREQNEVQSIINRRIEKLGNAIFKDGDIVAGAQIVVNAGTGEITATAGSVYINGRIWDAPEASFTIPVTGVVSVGLRLHERVISELEDPELRNPAIGNRAEGLPGAWRLQEWVEWGYEGDGGEGDFYPVYSIEDGQPVSREAPPSLDSFNQAIARYDRDSTGTGTYVCNGMTVTRAADAGDGRQVYCVAEGRARIGGIALDLPVSRRVYYDAQPDLRVFGVEIATAKEGKTRVNAAHPPIKCVDSLRVTKEAEFEMVHGVYQGCSDALPVTGVTRVISVKQLDTVFEEGTDFTRVGDTLDWSLSGAEPANGSTYKARLQYLCEVDPEELDLDGFSVSGAVPESQIIFGYQQMLPRYDRLAIDQEGRFVWFRGIASERNPISPFVPDNLLALATVYQNWRPSRTVEFDADCVFSFATIAAMQRRIEYFGQELGRNRLELDAQSRESGARKGIFVDPLDDDSMRDQGLVQNAAIVDGYLLLPAINLAVNLVSRDVSGQTTRPFTPKVFLDQPLRTGEMQVNPYMAFDMMPALVTLNPAVDRWTETSTAWTSAVTRITRSWHAIFHNQDKFDTALDGVGGAAYRVTGSSSRVETVSSATHNLEYLRQIDVKFTITGFGPGEQISTATFDGLNILGSLSATEANAAGEVNGQFRIPANVPAGFKEVVFAGRGGSYGRATFVGQGQLVTQTLRKVQEEHRYYYTDPLAQTFVPERRMALAGVDLWFTVKGGETRVHIRNVENGVPGKNVIAEAILAPEKINVGNWTRALFDCPVPLEANTEYAVVVLCNDAKTSLALAQMGKFDMARQQWVTAQPYAVGVMLSSSNASTWSDHQDRDLTFRLLEADFANDTPLTVDLGVVTVNQATDIVVRSLADTPTSACSVEYLLQMPDNGGVYAVAENQPVHFTERISGEIGVSARLSGTADASAILWPGTQVISSGMADQADYYTRSITAKGATKATLIYEAFAPQGSQVKAKIQIDSGEWLEMTRDEATPGDNGFVEHTLVHELENAEMIKVKFELSGTPAASPAVMNIRLLATA